MPDSSENKQALHEQARQASNRGSHLEAIELLRILLKQDPQNCVYQSELGYEFLEQGDAEAALRAFQEAIAVGNQNEKAWSGLGSALSSLGKFEAAEAAFRRAIELKPRSYDFVFLADILNKRKMYKEAIEICDKVLEIDSANEEAYLNLAIALNGESRYQEAMDELETAITLNPDYVEAYYVLGMTQYARRKYSVAERAFRDALMLRPNHPWAMFYLALTLWQMNRIEEAEQTFRNTLSISNDPLITKHYSMFTESRRAT